MVEAPTAALPEGSVRFAVERFALTANTTTYALFGDQLAYWGFFPTEAGWGRVPAIGWGRIVESANPDVAVGGRYFGWFPMARWFDAKVSATREGVRDEGEHRAPHAPVYRSFADTSKDAMYQAGDDAEDRQALLRGLFLTGFLADDFFADADYFGASRILVVSASSKTGIGFAECAAARGKAEVIGLTSAGNAEFVKSVGCYGRVVTYDEIDALPADSDAVVVDMAGNGAVIARIHERLDDRLKYSMVIGKSHADAPDHPPPDKGPRRQMFFAPTQVQKRMQDWGHAGYQSRTAEALRRFVEGSARWLEVERMTGADAIQQTWLDTLDGKVPPTHGRIIAL